MLDVHSYKVCLINNHTLEDVMREVCCGDTSDRRNAICNILKRNGIEPLIFQSEIKYPTTNIVIPAKDQLNKIVISAHYDVVWKSSGYNDNGSGVLAALIVGLSNKNPHVEVVFTDREELGGGGADFYIDQNHNNIKYNINLDVCGLPGSIYIDNNISQFDEYLLSLNNVRFGLFPFCDGHVFRESGIPSISLSSGPTESEMSFREGISYIFSTIHNNKKDNDISLISFEMIVDVANMVIDLINNYNGVDGE